MPAPFAPLISRVVSSPLIALPLRNRNFGAYAAGSGVSLVGMWMQRIAIGWLTWELTGSGFWLGLVAFADHFPIVVIGPIAGTVADRLDRLTVLRTTVLLTAISGAVLWLLTVTGLINIGLLVTLATIQGIIVAFTQPARLALVPSLVEENDLPSAVAIHSIIFNTARFIGPVLAGAAILRSGVAAAFAVHVVTFFFFQWALGRIRIASSADASSRERSFLADIWEGIAYTARHPAIAAMLVLLIAVGMGSRPISELFPGLADEVFNAGAAGLSTLAAAVAAGGLVGALWMGNRRNTTGLVRLTLAGTVFGAVAAMGSVATENLWVAAFGVACFGFGMSVAGIALQTYVQLTSDKRMRGRVMGLYALIFRGTPALGALTAGFLSTYLGLRWPIVLGSLLVIAVGAIIWLRQRRLLAAASEAVEAGPALADRPLGGASPPVAERPASPAE